MLHGRTDKKFCNDHCRNEFHNRQNSCSNNYMRIINFRLRRNRRILSALLSAKHTTRIGIEQMHDNGFAFDYFTHMITNEKGITCFFCYEYGYLKHGGQVIIIREKKNH
ncbi:hypothetical protein GWC94_14030 [Sediminibacterium sp. WSJ-3]|nr:hypothetical protein [Sediminibacterium soli]